MILIGFFKYLKFFLSRHCSSIKSRKLESEIYFRQHNQRHLSFVTSSLCPQNFFTHSLATKWRDAKTISHHDRTRLPPPPRLLSKDLTGIPRNVHGKANAAVQDAIQDALPATLIPPTNQYPVPWHAIPALHGTQKRNSRSNVDAGVSLQPLSRNSLASASCVLHPNAVKIICATRKRDLNYPR